MPKFSEYFNLNKTQAELDFVNVDLARDTPLYLCPYAIQIRADTWSSKCTDHIRSFFSEVLDQLRAGNFERAYHLLGHLHEPNETFLGQSKGRPSGRGIGNDKAQTLGDALINSKAFKTGILSDISDAELFIHGVGPDTISDLTTNILRGLFAAYTEEQCKLFDIPVQQTSRLGPVWNPVSRNWEAKVLALPHYHAQPILLVPKFSVRLKLSLDSQEFYNFHMVEYLQAEYLHSSSALVETLKNGTRRVTKKSVKEIHPPIKDDLAIFVHNHPEVLEAYKKLKGAKGTLKPNQLDTGFDEAIFAQVLTNKLTTISTGSATANDYHNLMIGICTFLFHPYLIEPIKEHAQDDGRKRVDIKYTNAAQEGHFHRMLEAAQTRALSVFIECKNYTGEIGNPDFDQLSGRYGHTKGFYGMLVCRQIENREKAIASCKATARDGRGYSLVLEDRDIIEMLGFILDGKRSAVNSFLEQRFAEISD